MKTLIRNGAIVMGQNTMKADLLTENGTVRAEGRGFPSGPLWGNHSHHRPPCLYAAGKNA